MVNLETISNIWKTVVESNLFNFIIFVAILTWIFKKINVADMISSLQKKIIKILDDVKKNHDEAKNELENASKAVKNLDSELKTIVEEASKSASVIGDKILDEAKKQIENIESNAEKIISAEEKMLISKLTKNTSKASVKIAKDNIVQVLEQTPTLHEKYINESIDELDRLSF